MSFEAALCVAPRFSQNTNASVLPDVRKKLSVEWAQPRGRGHSQGEPLRGKEGPCRPEAGAASWSTRCLPGGLGLSCHDSCVRPSSRRRVLGCWVHPLDLLEELVRLCRCCRLSHGRAWGAATLGPALCSSHKSPRRVRDVQGPVSQTQPLWPCDPSEQPDRLCGLGKGQARLLVSGAALAQLPPHMFTSFSDKTFESPKSPSEQFFLWSEQGPGASPLPLVMGGEDGSLGVVWLPDLSAQKIPLEAGI